MKTFSLIAALGFLIGAAALILRARDSDAPGAEFPHQPSPTTSAAEEPSGSTELAGTELWAVETERQEAVPNLEALDEFVAGSAIAADDFESFLEEFKQKPIGDRIVILEQCKAARDALFKARHQEKLSSGQEHTYSDEEVRTITETGSNISVPREHSGVFSMMGSWSEEGGLAQTVLTQTEDPVLFEANYRVERLSAHMYE